MELQELQSLISSLGFPIVVAVWLLYRDYRFISAVCAKLDTLIAQLGALLATEEEK